MLIDPKELLLESFSREKEIKIFKEIFEKLFAFNEKLKFDINIFGIEDKKKLQPLFLEYFERYLFVHVVPKVNDLFSKSNINEGKNNIQDHFIQALSNLHDLSEHFISFWSELKLDAITFEVLVRKIKQMIIYEVLQKMNFKNHLQYYFQDMFGIYHKFVNSTKENTKNKIARAQDFELKNKEHKWENEYSLSKFKVGYVHVWVLYFYGNDEIFKSGAYNMLNKKIIEFVKKFNFDEKNRECFSKSLNWFSDNFIKGFLEKISKYVILPGDQKRKKETDPMSPILVSNAKPQNSSFQKQSNQAKVEMIHTEESNMSMALLNEESPFNLAANFSKSEKTIQMQLNKTQNSKFSLTQLTHSLNLLLHKLFIKKAQPYIYLAITEIDKRSTFIEDIGKSLVQAESNEELIEYLEKEIKFKLTRNSNSTQTILKFYIDLLGFWDLLCLDYSRLQKLISPLKAYLISRNDSLRVIISTLMEEMNKRKSHRGYNSTEPVNVGMEIEERIEFSEDEASEDLNFDLPTKTSEFASTRKKKTDVKVLLADLYGSKERFFAEYESFVAEKLLYFEEVNVEDEQANVNFLLNHLKIANEHQKFGIIVNDLNASAKWTDSFFEKSRNSLRQFEFLVLSEAFWPLKKEFECFTMPIAIGRQAQESFNEHFKSLKKQTYVKFHNNLGLIEMDFELNGKILSLRTPPIFAVLLMIFSEKQHFENGISFLEIQSKLDYDSEFVSQAISFWVNNEVMLEEKISSQKFENLEEENLIDCEHRKYSMNKNYANEKIYFTYNEKDNFLIQSEADQKELNEKPIYFQLRLQKLILNIMNGRNGSCQREHLLDLIKSIYKNELQSNLIDQHFEVCLQKLTKRKALIKKGDVYYCV